MKRFAYITIPLTTIGLFLLVAYFFPLPVAVNSDFRVLYYTDKALVQGVDIYDHEEKVELVARQEDLRVEQVSAFPSFAYPPWLALGTFYLGYFSIHSAGTLWFEINLTALLFSIWFLTDRWPARKRLISFLSVFLFVPVFGTLVVGQYDFPVLLGAALLSYALKKEKAFPAALGIFFLTFKPHLGGLLIFACLAHFIFRRDNFGRGSLKWTAMIALAAFAVGFIADSAWLLNYMGSLMEYRDLGHITTCSECANLSVWLAKWSTGELSLSVASRFAAVILIFLLWIITRVRPPLWKFPILLVNSILFITLIASPYLYNYNYLLLLVPMFWLAGEDLTPVEWGILFTASLLPAFGLGLFGRDGNIAFLVSTLVIAWMFVRRTRLELAQALNS
jgi:hypothetical protein